jgi:hypothetical protein
MFVFLFVSLYNGGADSVMNTDLCLIAGGLYLICV